MQPQSPEGTTASHAPVARQPGRSPFRQRLEARLELLHMQPPQRGTCPTPTAETDGVSLCSVHDADLNRVQLTGVLGGEPLLSDVGDHPIARLGLASARRWQTPAGRIQLETIWFNLTAWEELAAYCGRALHGGDRVYVEGRLHLWHERYGRWSAACHTVVLDRIVLLSPARGQQVGAEHEHQTRAHHGVRSDRRR